MEPMISSIWPCAVIEQVMQVNRGFAPTQVGTVANETGV